MSQISKVANNIAQDTQSVWSHCLTTIRELLGNENEEVFSTWFQPIKPYDIHEAEDGSPVLTLQLPSQFFCDWLEAHYINVLKKTIQYYLGDDATLQYRILMDTSDDKNPITTQIPSSGVQTPANKPVYLPINVNSNGNDKSLPNPLVIPGIQKVQLHSQLNDRYTFANFVEGECNRLARSAGFAVAKNPGRTSFNPLLIYGGVGLGKTHLVNAIGLQTKEMYPDKRVLYVTSEQFMQQFSAACKEGARNDFMNFYGLIDELIIDDIQFWSDKYDKTQEAFFHIFNELHQRGKQIVITSDKAPSEIKGLDDRLISRMKWGLSADVSVPDVDTRISILKQKLKNDGIEMPNDVVEYVAYSVNTNVRELEGALISLVAQSSLNKKEITLELTREMIDNFVRSSKQDITIEYIQKIVCDYLGQTLESVQSKVRKREIVQARQLIMYFAKKLTNSSLAIIGAKCGNKDHATVLHACKTVENLMNTDNHMQRIVVDLEKKFTQ